MKEQIAETIEEIRSAAARYYQLTGKPVGVTGEVGEYDAARLLGLTLANVRQAGYDAVKPSGERVQIKTRAGVSGGSRVTGRTPAIKTTHDWESVMLVLMDRTYTTLAIYEADRAAIEGAKIKTESKARNEGKLAVAEFIRLSKKVWPVVNETTQGAQGAAV